MKNLHAPYTISVLSDLTDSTHATLETAISIAQAVNGRVHLFHVKKPNDLVTSDNQLSATRSLNTNYVKTENKLKQLVGEFSAKHTTPITYSFAFGNIKNEIETYLTQHKPDVIVIGKKTSAPLNFLGNGVTEVVLKTHQGEIIIASDTNKLTPNQFINLGFLNELKPVANPDFFDHIVQKVKGPIKTFQFTDAPNPDQTVIESFKNKQVIEYIFEKSNNVINSLTTYIQQNKVNLLCLPRQKKNNSTEELDINDVLNKIQVSLLITPTIN